MTEEIIINGVNVAGCEFYYEGECCQTNYKNEIFTKRCKCSDKLCYYKQLKRLEQENKELKEKIIKLTEENGNLIINRNTVENKLRDTESRLISIQKANTHNLVLLQRRNNALEEIKVISDNYNLTVNERRKQIADKINEVLK